MKTLLAACSSLLLLAAAGGCGAGDDASSPPPPPPAAQPPAAGRPVPGGGLTVAEALATDADGPLAVRGALVADRSGVRLCSALAESYPPQCGGPSLAVDGLDLDRVRGLREAEGVRWTEGEVTLLGEVEGGRLRIAERSI